MRFLVSNRTWLICIKLQDISVEFSMSKNII
uniref:Uncharacterized protein n=1 Tax=Anguilla anguilla TaxID=7936 RepID=A0A0E9RQ32_ANGAN